VDARHTPHTTHAAAQSVVPGCVCCGHSHLPLVMSVCVVWCAGIGGLSCAALLAKYGVKVGRVWLGVVGWGGRRARLLGCSTLLVPLAPISGSVPAAAMGHHPFPRTHHTHCQQVTVVESHSVPGGAAHTWRRGGFHFESGPSLYSGMNGACLCWPCSGGALEQETD
jgi:hypothetical protein